MKRTTEIALLPQQCATEELTLHHIRQQCGLDTNSQVHILRKSLDARRQPIRFHLEIEITTGDPHPSVPYEFNYQNVENSPHVVIIGSGPAGLFAALRLIELGLKPLLFERGKDVRERRRDLALITKQGTVNPDSNYCFGEGGAGTYSDGKLYTRSTKRGDVKKILHILVQHGADENILYEAHPHIGTNKLPAIIGNIRNTITQCGGAFHFNSRLTDMVVQDNKVKSVQITGTSTGAATTIPTSNVILATGHSARDIFTLLHARNILIEAKPFALGVRIEHPQQLIDSVQYKCEDRGPFLPPATYSLVNQSLGHGVFSFCMCPGGIIAPAATAPGEIVVNGWSPSKRNNPFANSGMVVSVDHKDLKGFEKHGALAALRFQASVEQSAFALTKSLQAPAQRVADFVNKKMSAGLPACSYLPGIVSSDLDEVLPSFVSASLRDALKTFGKKMKGYVTNEAVLVATESRTSSPVRIPRDKETLEHVQVEGLYPCGEGAGYAGGIISAALDGENCAHQLSLRINR